MNQSRIRTAFRVLGALFALFAAGGPVKAQVVDQASDPAAVAETQRLAQICRDGRGELEACLTYAQRVYHGVGAPQDHAAPLLIWDRLCERDSGQGCTYAGGTLLFSNLVPHDDTRALPYLERGCALQAGVSCLLLGQLRFAGRGTVADPERARGHFNYACIYGVGEGCRMEGRMYLEGLSGTQTHEGNAVSSFQLGCGLQDWESCGLLAYAAHYGRGMTPDPDLAVQEYLRACAGGVAFSCEAIEGIRTAGAGAFGFAQLTSREAVARAFPSSLPAEQRYILASAALANGQTSLAVGAFETLAEEGLADANFILAQMFYTGQGVAMDRPRALRYFQRAANRRHPHAMYVLGQFNWYAIDMNWNPDWGIAMMRGAEEAGLAEAGPIWRQWQAERNAYFEGRDAANRQMAIENEQSQAAADAANMSRIWGLYSSGQNQQDNEQVCGMIYRNNQANQECMARETFDAYYNPNR